MRNKLIFLIAMMLLTGLTSTAQIKVDVKKKINREANRRANANADKAIDKGFDSMEEGIGDLFRKEEKKEETAKETKVNASKDQKEDEAEQQEEEAAGEARVQPQPQLSWAKYDFVPGTEIIFEDNHEGEQNGEFPGKWDMKSGVIENAEFDGSNVIYFRETGNAPNGIVPMMKDCKSDYLPDEFTIEFDAYFEADKFNRFFWVHFYDAKNQKRNMINPLKIDINSIDFGDTKKLYPGAARSNIDKTAKWRHIAISFNKRALKVYMDDTRMLNIPNITENPTGITIGAYNHKEGMFFIKNIRIAQGAVPLYDKFLTDNKFITTGIRFDVGKATIKPESMGTINYVVKMMTDHPDLNFSVEGHTDSDGSDATNQSLSEARARAVMEKMIELGISAERLKSTGYGESKPLADNSTSEGKAQNRRVEFVKF